MTISASLSRITPADLPAPPQAVLAMLQACARDKVDHRQLADFAQLDPVLSAEVLRVVNSPLLGLASEVTSVQHAISLLGMRALYNIVLCLLVREAVTQHTIPGVDITHFWEDSLRRAAAARGLGKLAGLDPDECFSAGLLQDFGLLLLFALQLQFADRFAGLRELDPVQRLQAEMELFGITHTEIAAMLAQHWSLPERLVGAIAAHHTADASPGLAQVLYATDWINAVFCAKDINPVLETVRDMLTTRFALEAERVERMLAELPAQVQTAAHSLGLHIQPQLDFEQLLRRANSRLARENLSYQELTWRLENTIAERDRLARELAQEIAIAREVQQRLMPDTTAHNYPLQGINLPARHLSGDFYDYFTHPDGDIWFALGDVSGKGINAGLLMAKTASLFHCLAKHTRDPAQLLAIINDEICEHSVRGFFVTMVAGVYQPASKTLRLVNAGHLPALLFQRNGRVVRLPATEQPLGILPGTRFTLSKPVALKHAALYLYTDGITEAPLPGGGMLEENGLMKLLQAHQALAPRERLAAIVKAIAPQHTANPELHDDVTLLLIDGGSG